MIPLQIVTDVDKLILYTIFFLSVTSLILEDAKPDQMGLISEMYKNHGIREWLGL